MNDLMADYRAVLAERGIIGAAAIDSIRIGKGVSSEVFAYVRDKGFRQVLVVTDSHTRQAAGELHLTDAHWTMVQPNALGDVVADEASVVQILLDLQQVKADVLIALGSGTIHDLARYAAFTAGIPFLSVPTAASVDGFTSIGAPLLIRGEKQTVAAVAPLAVFADLTLLMAAPAWLTAAGFGDMLGKYTSLFDWRFGHLTGGEPYDSVVAEMTSGALQACVEQVEAIASGSAAGIETLMRALLQSGLAMLLLGSSHPASGAEHHLSHYWEMAYLRQGRKQLLHGAKVGVASVEIARLYHQIGEQGLLEQLVLPHAADRASKADRAASVTSVTSATSVNRAASVLRVDGVASVDTLDALSEALRAIPSPAELQRLLALVGGPADIGALGVSEQLLEEALGCAHQVRPGRFTLLRAYNSQAASFR